MDPIIAGSLVSVGKNLIQGISNKLTSEPEVNALGNNTFSQELNKVSSDSVKKTVMNAKALHASLLEDPQVSSFVEKNKDCQVFFGKESGWISEVPVLFRGDSRIA